MNKIKISLKDWTYIGQYNRVRPLLRKCCNYTLTQEENGNFKREQKIALWFYILAFIPIHLIDALLCMWDSGLKSFELQSRYIGFDVINKNTNSWNKAKEIYEKHLTK